MMSSSQPQNEPQPSHDSKQPLQKIPEAAEDPSSSSQSLVGWVRRRSQGKSSMKRSTVSDGSLAKISSLSAQERARICLSRESSTHPIRTPYFSTRQEIEMFLRSLDTSGPTRSS